MTPPPAAGTLVGPVAVRLLPATLARPPGVELTWARGQVVRVEAWLSPQTRVVQGLPLVRLSATTLVLASPLGEAWFNRVTGKGMAGAKGGPRVVGERAKRRARDWRGWRLVREDAERFAVEDPTWKREHGSPDEDEREAA